MKNFVQEGDVLTLTAPSGGVVAGTPVSIGSLVVVPTISVAQTLPFTGLVVGVIKGVKVTGGGTAWTEGLKIYWDASAQKFTKTVISDTGDALVGVATAAAADGDAFGYIRLDGVAR